MSRYVSKFPLKMSSGGPLGIAAPSGHFDRTLFARGIEILENMGFEVLVPESVFKRCRFFAGSDEQRVSLLHELFENPDVHGIICARGGYGSMRLLPFLDFDLISSNPKPLIGFSDATAILETIHERTGLICYHGPMVTTLPITDEKGLKSFENILKNGIWEMECSEGTVINDGEAEGTLKGGNLTTLCHLTGTDFEPDFTDSILMLEDIGEAPYRIDRMLTQMKMAGLFNGIRAVVAGNFTDCGEIDVIEDVLRNTFLDFSIPVVSGFYFGHGLSNMSFPIGGMARLDTELMSVSMA